MLDARDSLNGKLLVSIILSPVINCKGELFSFLVLAILVICESPGALLDGDILPHPGNATNKTTCTKKNSFLSFFFLRKL